MQATTASVPGIIRAKICEQGPLSFAQFMELALYHPEHGYYSSDRCVIGRRGDYFTNVSVGPVFGQLLAVQFAEIWESLRRPDLFYLVEQGAHHGEFARDALAALRRNAPQFFSAVRYRIVEPSPILRARQEDMLRDFRDWVDWRESVDQLEPFAGIFFCNELLDAMPVHLIVSQGEENPTWMEKFVEVDGDKFVFIERPIDEPKLLDRLRTLPARPAGYETELNLAVPEWIDALSQKLRQGFVFAIDYGFPREEFYAENRTAGTLQCRSQHQSIDSPFERVGQADITAHVDWTHLAEHAQQAGLHLAGFADQHHFLTGILSFSPGIAEEGSPKTRRALQTLLHPEMLGRSFQVLALSKDVDPAMSLSGFQFARDPRVSLGL